MRAELRYGDPRPAIAEQKMFKKHAELNAEELGTIPFEDYTREERNWVLHSSPESKRVIFDCAIEEENNSVIIGLWGMALAHIARDQIALKETKIGETDRRSELFKDLHELTQLESDIDTWFSYVPPVEEAEVTEAKPLNRLLNKGIKLAIPVGGTAIVGENAISTGNPAAYGILGLIALATVDRIKQRRNARPTIVA